MGPRVLAQRAFEVEGGSEVPDRSPTLNEQWHPVRILCLPGGSVSLALGFGCPQYPALPCQAPWEGPLGGRLRVRVSPHEDAELSQRLCGERRGGPS